MLALAFLGLPTQSWAAGYPVFDALAYEELRWIRAQQGHPLLTDTDRPAAATIQGLKQEGVGKTTLEMQGQAALQEAFGITIGTLFPSITDKFTGILGQEKTRNPELHRLYTQTYLAAQNLENVLLDTAQRMKSILATMEHTVAQANRATNHAELLKLNTIQQGLHAQIQALKLEQDAAKSRFDSLEAQARTYAEQNAQANEDEQIQAIRDIPVMVSSVFKTVTGKFQIPDPRKGAVKP